MKKKYSKPSGLWLIIRGKQPDYHNAPYHPIILCSRKHTAEWESRDVTKGATVLYNAGGTDRSGNWFLGRYKGYDCDTNQYFTLFDGVDTGDFTDKTRIETEVISKAVWWSYDLMPDWIRKLGCKFPNDEFTKRMILDDSGTCIMSESKSLKYEKRREKYDIPEWLEY